VVAAIAGWTAAYAWVAAPWATVFSASGPTREKRACATDGMWRPRLVLMTPGWMALEVRRVPASRRASSFAKSRLASLDWP
jgi:hypothetical protein